MPYRKTPLVEGCYYHIYTKSIAEYKIFNSVEEYQRGFETMNFYRAENPPCRFSSWFSPSCRPEVRRPEVQKEKGRLGQLARIIAYCFMPTHLHLILQQLKEDGISRLMSLMLNSYSSYFNRKHNRKGPLWESRFKVVVVKNDEQLLHLTRYIHLNPVTSRLVNKPEEWVYSSHREYLGLVKEEQKICDFSGCLEVDPLRYQRFVCDRIDYQRKLAKIKKLLMDV
jgi:putative transposase